MESSLFTYALISFFLRGANLKVCVSDESAPLLSAITLNISVAEFILSKNIFLDGSDFVIYSAANQAKFSRFGIFSGTQYCSKLSTISMRLLISSLSSGEKAVGDDNRFVAIVCRTSADA